tara:strand:+ start:12091 stop:12438 length:348 start_codon:yes stop_codon:yes gene_type:complete
MNATINATICDIRQTKVITEKFSVQEVIIESSGDYPEKVAIQFINDKVSLVDNLNVGDNCDFDINIRGSEYTPKGSSETKYFTNLNCWKLDVRMGALPEDLQNSLKDTTGDDLPF